LTLFLTRVWQQKPDTGAWTIRVKARIVDPAGTGPIIEVFGPDREAAIAGALLSFANRLGLRLEDDWSIPPIPTPQTSVGYTRQAIGRVVTVHSIHSPRILPGVPGSSDGEGGES
jgi:hypothetical protein